jgi:hypothetical protein
MRWRRSAGKTPGLPAKPSPAGFLDSAKGYPLRVARKLLIEFVGGERGEMPRDQFA